jgi:2-polyprenyl-6-methoxyphenol hydroxylase-like FAD-dependent oxidoreductase
MENRETQVLIAGAGPTGLALACDLARRGVGFRIVDKAPEHFIGSKGKGLQPRSLEVLDDFGIIDQILAVGRFHIPFRGYEGSKVLGERDIHEGRNPTPSTPYASPLILPQWRVEEKLRGLLEAHGGKVELATELVGLEQDEDGVTARLQSALGGEHVRCQYVVAADGGKSFVRKLLAVPFEGETWADERMYVGDVRVRGLDREAWHAWTTHPAGLLTLCPLPSTDQYQLQAQVPKGDEREPSLELFREIVRERTEGMDIELLDASWVSLYRANVRMVSNYRVGRIFLAGDAAHVHSPAGGQGMNTGIQDAYNLGWKLASVLRGAPAALLETYEEERMPVAANVLGVSSKLHRQITSDGDEKLRRDGVTLQLGITYKAMSLSRRAGGAVLAIDAGDRVPDSPGVDASGKPLRMFDVLRGPQFTLLRLFPEDGAVSVVVAGVKQVDVVRAGTAAAEGVFVDAFGHAAEAYGGGHGEYLLVRPDGYAGWAGTADTLDDLREYLRFVN